MVKERRGSLISVCLNWRTTMNRYIRETNREIKKCIAPISISCILCVYTQINHFKQSNQSIFFSAETALVKAEIALVAMTVLPGN